MRKKTIDTIPVLSAAMKKLLSAFSKSRSLPSGLVKRSNIILLAAQGELNRDIALQASLHYNNVATWRNRFLATLPALRQIETAYPEKLEGEICKVLSDRNRSGAPSVFTPDQIMKIIDLACSNPGDWGYEVSQWSLPLLVTEIIKQGIADQISAKSVSRFLKMR
ncbi:helix-turn-helix domain-containing protein [Lachnospiraceae bacterium 45-W7]